MGWIDDWTFALVVVGTLLAGAGFGYQLVMDRNRRAAEKEADDRRTERHQEVLNLLRGKLVMAAGLDRHGNVLEIVTIVDNQTKSDLTFSKTFIEFRSGSKVERFDFQVDMDAYPDGYDIFPAGQELSNREVLDLGTNQAAAKRLKALGPKSFRAGFMQENGVELTTPWMSDLSALNNILSGLPSQN